VLWDQPEFELRHPGGARCERTTVREQRATPQERSECRGSSYLKVATVTPILRPTMRYSWRANVHV